MRVPLPGGGQATYGNTGLTGYRHPNWQGTQTLATFPTASSTLIGSSFTPFGESYNGYPNGSNNFFAGMLGIASDAPIGDGVHPAACFRYKGGQ